MSSRLRTLLVVSILLLILAGLLAAAEESPIDHLGPILRSLVLTPPSVLLSAIPIGDQAAPDELSVIIDYEGDAQALREAGAMIGTQLGSIITARIPADSVERIASIPGLRYIQLSRRFYPVLDVSVPSTHASSLRSGVSPNWAGYTGRGVVIGMVDTGIDPNHQDFTNSQGSRILYIWDQTSGGANPPNLYNYGTEWTKAQIDAGLCTQRDTSGHGTGVMGIAAGNGSATGNGWPAYRYVGMAPEADIIVVKSTFTDATIIDGMSYIRSRAQALGKPCVINLSIGSQIGAHDGTDAIERAIDQLVGQGVVVCTATGNNGTTDPTRYVHARWSTPSRNSQVTAGLNVLSNRADPFYMDLWYDGQDSIDITLTSPNGYSVTKSTGSSSNGYVTTPDGGIWIENAPGSPNPYNGDRECIIAVQNGVSGAWSVTATGRTIGSDGVCDAWIETGHNVFWSSCGTNAVSCTIPGTGNSVITAGGYLTKSQWTNPDGIQQGWASTLESYYSASGEGPTRDGRQKPDLCAPTTRIATSLSANYNVNQVNLVEDGVHSVQTGTSMAAPHVTGAIALLLQRDPTATAAEIKSYIVSTARTDSFTGAVPNTRWGAGKLDAQSAASATPMCTDISTARIQPHGTPVKIPGQVVTAGLSQMIDRFYIESDDRSSAIQVRTGSGSGIQAEEGSRVTVKGTVGLADGERAVLSPVVYPAGTGVVPQPLALLNRCVGGGALGDNVPGISGGHGLNNVGLLVTVWGRVTAVDSDHFYIDDGTRLTNGSQGLKVSCGSLAKPLLNQHAVATGISAIEWNGSVALPVVRARKQADLTCY